MNPDFLPKNYKEYLGLGAEIAASLLIPMFGGYYLDQVFNSSPVGILFGVILGIILFFITTTRIVKKMNSMHNDKETF